MSNLKFIKKSRGLKTILLFWATAHCAHFFQGSLTREQLPTPELDLEAGQEQRLQEAEEALHQDTRRQHQLSRAVAELTPRVEKQALALCSSLTALPDGDGALQLLALKLPTSRSYLQDSSPVQNLTPKVEKQVLASAALSQPSLTVPSSPSP